MKFLSGPGDTQRLAFTLVANNVKETNNRNLIHARSGTWCKGKDSLRTPRLDLYAIIYYYIEYELVIDSAIAASRQRSHMFVEQYRCSYANERIILSTTAVA